MEFLPVFPEKKNNVWCFNGWSEVVVKLQDRDGGSIPLSSKFRYNKAKRENSKMSFIFWLSYLAWIALD